MFYLLHFFNSFRQITLVFSFIFSVDEKEEIVTPEMPLFQSDEGKFLSTKKINNAQKMQQIEQNQIEDNKENDQESPQMPRLNTYEAKVMLSTKKPSSFKKHPSPEKDTAKDDSFLMDSPEMPIMKTINLKSVIQQAKGTYL